MSWLRRAARVLALTLLAAVLVSVLAVLALRFVPPLTTSFILQARFDALSTPAPELQFRREWRALAAISPQLQLAVVAAEDQRFAEHQGFDFKQIHRALEEAGRGGRARGASTISQQVAKNLFLWGGHSWLRKGLEAWFTLLIELCWPKQRILEMYLNIAQFGPGIYGAEAAAQVFFHSPARQLNREQAARLAAVLPSPERMNAGRPGPYVLRRQRQIEAQMSALGGTGWLARLAPPAQNRPRAASVQ
ncbi:MAG: monofunctional biosynthetic peptidoglycan transglycosylase [Steroidobacteraceae bacterium]